MGDLSEINVTSFALEVPTECILGASSERGVIGAWTAVRRLSHNGDDHVPGKQISRWDLLWSMRLSLVSETKLTSIAKSLLGMVSSLLMSPTPLSLLSSMFCSVKP